MSNGAIGRHEGHKLQLWVSDESFSVLQRKAHRDNISLAEAARRLMQSGIAPSETTDNILEGLVGIDRFISSHLEPLIFVAAIDAAKVAAYWKRRVYLETHRGTVGADEAKALAEKVDRAMAEHATKRIKRVLREIDHPIEPPLEEESDHDADDEEDEV